MPEPSDIVLIHPGDKKSTYQELGNTISALEPPIWCAMIASYLRSKKINVQIIDANAENLSPSEVAGRINDIQPVLCGILVAGVHPSASTQTMPSAIKISHTIKQLCDIPIALAGLHPTALPKQSLRESLANFVIEGNGMHSFEALLNYFLKKISSIEEIPGLWFYSSPNIISFTFKAPPLSSFPSPSWDLLPMSLYQAHNWQCLSNISCRKPYASLYTSIGCPYHCKFCCVHTFWQSHHVIYRSADDVISDIDQLVHQYNIKYLKIADENFLLNSNHYMPIIEQLIDRKYTVNIWIYGRIDAIRKKQLPLLRKAGIQWIALGIESADEAVLHDVKKPVQQQHIMDAVTNIQQQGMSVIGNFIFGLPNDNIQSLDATLRFAQQLKCEFVNFNCMMPFPGTIYYEKAIQSGIAPSSWESYSQHSYDTHPLPTLTLSSREILEFRDQAFQHYFSRPSYLEMIQKKFGLDARHHVENMNRKRLKRKLLT